VAEGALARGGEFLREVAICRALLAARLRGEMQYRASFVLQVVGNGLIHALELLTIVLLFGRFSTLGGWTTAEVAFLYGLSAFSFGVAHTIASGLSSFDEQIRRGEFDRVLTRPVGAFLQVLASDLQLRRLGGILQGLVVLVISLRLLDVAWTPGRVLYLPVAIASTIALFVALFAMDATFSFWTIEGSEAVNALTYGGTNLANYPLHIFDTWLRRLFLWVIPLGFVVYAPALYILDKPTPLNLPAWTRFTAPLAALLFSLVAAWLWGVGVRRYRSTGS
jgi:ABC-2 type transport system permease protein